MHQSLAKYHLLQFTNKGIYCPAAKLYVDPNRKVKTALITHGHSDHARPGHSHYVCANSSVHILRHRLGSNISIQGVKFGESINCNGVKISFHPAGHILGSAQIRFEYKNQIWVVTGDYKIEDDGISECFEQLTCTHLITECTFGLPIYKWKKQEDIFNQINTWFAENKELGRPSVILAYSLGKAQRILAGLNSEIGPIYVHSSIAAMNKVYEKTGISLPKYKSIENKTKALELNAALTIIPHKALSSEVSSQLVDPSIAVASGWMATRNQRIKSICNRGFALSDHCDWDGINTVVKNSGAEFVFPTHGNTDVLSRWLNEKGIQSRPLNGVRENGDFD